MHWHLGVASRWIAGCLVTVVPLACSSSHSPSGPSTGSLNVTVTAPVGITPSVIVTGPNSYRQLLRATTTLTGLATGSYVVTAAKVPSAARIVSVLYVGKIAGSPANVAADVTPTVTVKYAAAPGSGNLWATTAINNVNTVVAFDTAALDVSGTPTPGTTIPTIVEPTHTAFDSSGTLWVADLDTLVGYTSDQLAAGGAPTPAITINPPDTALTGSFTLAFDALGFLWVANIVSGNVVAYSPQQLAASGNPTPRFTLTSTNPFVNPEGIAFDARGNLWVTSAPAITGDTGTSGVQKFTPIQLVKGGVQTPSATLTGPGLEYASAIAFDVSGNLWLTNDRDTIAMYSATALAAGGAQTPTVLITGAALAGPDGLAFDNSGNLWVANGVGSPTESIVEFSASELTTSGTPTPAVTLTTNGTSILGTVGLTFYPHASGLPLN
jgi:sugar lactone lactonase YvrE